MTRRSDRGRDPRSGGVLVGTTGGGGVGRRADPTIAFCVALDAYATTLATFEALTPQRPSTEYKAAGAAAKAALAVLVTAAAPFAGAQINDAARRHRPSSNAVVDQLPPGATPPWRRSPSTRRSRT